MDEGKYACAGGEQRGTWAKRGRTRTREEKLKLLRGQSQRPPDAGNLYQKRCDCLPQSRGLVRFYLDGVTPLSDLPRELGRTV